MTFYRILLISSLLFLIASCYADKKKSGLQYEQAVQMDTLPGNCPYITKDSKGNTVISWARSVNDSVSVFCYAVSDNGGRSFGKTNVIPNSENIQPHSENLPKIIFKPSGEIMALWGIANPNPNNNYSGLVYYSQSYDDGVTWTKPSPLVSDTAGYDQRYYDVEMLPSGEIGIIWLDNRKTTDAEGSALWFASTAGRSGFQQQRIVAEGCCQCCRTELFIDSKAGIHVLYRGIIKDSIRDMLHSVSVDNGKTFSKAKRISNDNWVLKGCPHTGPAMTENSKGLHFAWFTGGAKKGCFYTQSRDNGESFDQHDRISASGSHPQLTTLRDGRLVVVWDESVAIKNQYYKRIAVQERSGNGANLRQVFITPDTVVATYPVVTSLDDRSAGIAYSRKMDEKNYILFQRVVIE